MPAPDPSESPLTLVHRGWDHLQLQRPWPAWACWRRALRIAPEDQAATEALAILESADEWPIAARAKSRFFPPGR